MRDMTHDDDSPLPTPLPLTQNQTISHIINKQAAAGHAMMIPSFPHRIKTTHCLSPSVCRPSTNKTREIIGAHIVSILVIYITYLSS